MALKPLVDTCCIDKSNLTELSMAINSMFRWYKNAARCYVNLSGILADAGELGVVDRTVHLHHDTEAITGAPKIPPPPKVSSWRFFSPPKLRSDHIHAHHG